MLSTEKTSSGPTQAQNDHWSAIPNRDRIKSSSHTGYLDGKTSMKSKRKTFLKCGGASLVTVLIPLFLIQQPVLSQELKESATEDISIETVEINTVTSFANEFEITDDGVLAKDKAAEMLERYPTLNANPYALLVKFDDLATPQHKHSIVCC